jgi:hypothetical protein
MVLEGRSVPGSRSFVPMNIARNRTKVAEAGRKSGRTTIMTVDEPPSKGESGR